MLDKPAWLPNIICIDNYGGDWEKYLKVIYKIFKKDFIRNPPIYESKKIYTIIKPKIDGKELGFWHLISEGKVEENRTPDLRRCERINWPKPIIKNCNCFEILIWKAKRHSDKRLYFWFEKFEYLIILSIRKNFYLLITSYLTDKNHTKRKLRKEYEAYNSRCRP